MEQNLVCTASTGHRDSCGSECKRCRHLKPDRRQQVFLMDWSAPERRVMSNLMPHGLRLAGSDFIAAATRTEAETAPYVWPVIFLLMSFNIFDCLLTARALSLGFAEANPVMAGLFSVSLPLAMVAKALLVSAGALFLWRYRHMPLAARGMTAVTICYGAVVVYHLAFQLSMTM